MTGPALVVFDVDGTLLDSQDLIVAAMAQSFAGLGRAAPSRAETLAIVGLSLPEAIAALAPGLSRPDLHRAVEGYKAGFLALRTERGGEAAAPLYPGARAVLDRLAGRPDLALGIATGKSRRGLDHMLAAHDLARHFITLQTADDHPSKPHPAMLAACLRDTGVAAARAVMVGDTEFDIAMGRAAGFRTVAVRWGYHPESRLAAADRIIDSFDDLDAVLGDVLG